MLTMKIPSVEDLVQLLNYCESFAMQMLSSTGEFYPFGAVISPEGRFEAMGANLGTEHPASQDQYVFLYGALAQMAKEGKIIGLAVAANVNIPEQYQSPLPDGIRVHIEAPDYSRYVYIPYRILSHQGVRKFLGFLPLVQYLEPITVELEPNAFPGTVD
jgi:hypothetical protein